MQKISSKRFGFSQICQITPSHCGPAVLQMLLSNLGLKTTQEAITKASGAEKKLVTHGTRVDQLAQAVATLFPQSRLWYKEKATIDDLRVVIREYGFPIGVEWQGIFEEENEEDEDDDPGHYSIIIDIDEESQEIVMIDPAREFASKERRLPIDVFLPRWWDTNEVIHPATGKKHLQEDNQLLFIVTPKEEVFPDKIGLKVFK